jgi:hypothetical protein
MSSQLHAPAALPPGKESAVHRRLGAPQNRYGRHGEEKILDSTDVGLVINYFILLSLCITDVIQFYTAFDFIAYQNKLKPSGYSLC